MISRKTFSGVISILQEKGIDNESVFFCANAICDLIEKEEQKEEPKSQEKKIEETIQPIKTEQKRVPKQMYRFQTDTLSGIASR